MQWLHTSGSSQRLEAALIDRDPNLEIVQLRTSPTGDREVHLGRYQLLRVVGRGGMGDVYEAWDPALERRIALKLLPDRGDGEQGLREARYLARVMHPNVVAVHDARRHAGLISIAMELVDGADLHRWLRERPRRWTEVLEHLLAAARGLSAIHRAGLVHGDMKPSNVLVGRDGRVRVADFGLARVRSRLASHATPAELREPADAHPPANNGTNGGANGGTNGGANGGATAWGGTQPYVAPECLRGVDSHCRADQFSFCVMAWEALFGVRPFVGPEGAGPRTEPEHSTSNGLDEDTALVGSLHRRPRGMPARIEAVLRRGLSEDPDARWPNMGALILELERARDRMRRKLGALALAAFAVLCCCIPNWVPAWAEPPAELEDTIRPRDVGPQVGPLRLELELAQPRLRFELWLVHARLQLRSGQPTEALGDAQRALALSERWSPIDVRAQARALAQIASAGARSSRCELADDALARMRARALEELSPSEQLAAVLEILDAFPDHAPERLGPACAKARLAAWTLAHKLSMQGLASAQLASIEQVGDAQDAQFGTSSSSQLTVPSALLLP